MHIYVSLGPFACLANGTANRFYAYLRDSGALLLVFQTAWRADFRNFGRLQNTRAKVFQHVYFGTKTASGCPRAHFRNFVRPQNT